MSESTCTVGPSARYYAKRRMLVALAFASCLGCTGCKIPKPLQKVLAVVGTVAALFGVFRLFGPMGRAGAAASKMGAVSGAANAVQQVTSDGKDEERDPPRSEPEPSLEQRVTRKVRDAAESQGMEKEVLAAPGSKETAEAVRRVNTSSLPGRASAPATAATSGKSTK